MVKNFNMIWKTPYNAIAFDNNYEVNTSPSLTIPDQSMSMSEIMRRFASGLPVHGERVPIYNGEDEDLPDLEHMDLADRESILKAVKADISDQKDRLNKKAAAKAEAVKQGSKARVLEYTEDEQGEEAPAPPVHPKKLPAEGPAGGE